MTVLRITAPPSKSLSHRVLIAAALAKGESRLSGVLESDDTARTRELFTALGARFDQTGAGAFCVTGLDGRISSRSRDSTSANDEVLSCFVGESGTTCRLAVAVLAAGEGTFRIHGAGRMHQRPLGELAGALTALGARIVFEQKPGCPPLLMEARGLDASSLPGGMIALGCDESSQYLSGLLLAAPLGRGLNILLGGSKVVSWPYVSLTLATLKDFGISVDVQHLDQGVWKNTDWRGLIRAEPGSLRFCVRPGTYRPGEHKVEGDWSGASYFLAAGAIGPKPVCVSGLKRDSLQGDSALLDILERMGARIAWDTAKEDVTVFPSPLRGLALDMGHCPDLVPTVAALAAHATGRTDISNVGHLKIKESDRLQAPAEELRKAGCRVAVTDDGLSIDPPERGLQAPERGVLFSAHNDHRIAMSTSLLGLPGITGRSGGFAVPLDDPGCVAKSFPHFWQLWEQVRA